MRFDLFRLGFWTNSRPSVELVFFVSSPSDIGTSADKSSRNLKRQSSQRSIQMMLSVLISRQHPPKLQQKRVQSPKDETPSLQLSPGEAGRGARTQLSHGEAEGNGKRGKGVKR
ncbi:hypothetical protein Bca4012_025881 [Brassica carinata]